MTRPAYWQPMSTAPRNGDIVDLLSKDGSRWTDEWWVVDDGDAFWACGFTDNQFVGWAPIPQSKPTHSPFDMPLATAAATAMMVTTAAIIILLMWSLK